MISEAYTVMTPAINSLEPGKKIVFAVHAVVKALGDKTSYGSIYPVAAIPAIYILLAQTNPELADFILKALLDGDERTRLTISSLVNEIQEDSLRWFSK